MLRIIHDKRKRKRFVFWYCLLCRKWSWSFSNLWRKKLSIQTLLLSKHWHQQINTLFNDLSFVHTSQILLYPCSNKKRKKKLLFGHYEVEFTLNHLIEWDNIYKITAMSCHHWHMTHFRSKFLLPFFS